MTDIDRPVTEDELHAYADGQLTADDRARLDIWLAANPSDAERVAGWMAQNEDLRRVFAGDAVRRATDNTMVAGAARGKQVGIGTKRRAMIAAAALLIFVAGVALGRYGNDLDRISPMGEAIAGTFPTEAKSAFIIYTSEVRHPVEVGADQQDHLVKWLGKRLDHPLKAPDLGALGFNLVGGRLIPVGGKAGALLMYQNEAGQRLTVLIGRNAENRETSFRYVSQGAIETFYWIDGPIGYAVTGEISRITLQQVADECYRQFAS